MIKIGNTTLMNLSLPEGFLDEETRCGYVISHEMKEIWAVELDLLSKFDQVCKKNNIIYYADGGTLLGAVRHSGMIPWDDDIDVMMSREEYARLCSIASSEFKAPYFFQTEQTDPGSLRGHAQLRNSDTTAILLPERDFHYDFNQGIFIDIFPYDHVPDDHMIRKKYLTHLERLRRRAKKYEQITSRYRNSGGVKGMTKKILHNSVYTITRGKDPGNPYYARLEKEATRYDMIKTKYCSSVSYKPIIYSGFYPCSAFKGSVYMDFEMLKIPVPSGYDKILRAYYGNWHEFKIGSNDHGDVIFDVNQSYKDYFSSMLNPPTDHI